MPPKEQEPSSKYAKMAQEEDEEADEDLRVQSRIKHELLLQWALDPPYFQTLRPIHVLMSMIHQALPPRFGIKPHEYFAKWKPLELTDVTDELNKPDENKVKKVVKKLRFFLHPDKLPRDLDKEQAFVCRILWDVVSDAEAEFVQKMEVMNDVFGAEG
jgi:hypothetical protein